MKIAVMGAGAVGCYYGGMLARAGHEVVLVGRPAHVQAVHEHGLWLDTLHFQERVRLQADTEAHAVHGAQYVLFCVKSTDTESAGRAMLPYLADGATVLSLQNGVDNAERLQALLQRPVLPAIVYVAAAMAGPGHVRHFGRGELVLPAAPTNAALANIFAAAGIPVELSDNVAGALWAKLVLNCVYNPLSAITGQPYGQIVNRPGLDVPRMMDDIVQECLAVARASGIVLPEGTAEAVLPLAASMPGQISSTAQDLARGRPTEIDHINGFIVRRGEALGIATPANRLLHTLVRLLEQATRVAGGPPGEQGAA
ncbi:MAG: 2-dehydropantoate 2-reductase [Burkholderiaceae bacterium]|nr:2-dehydropantoate 2-reductase [Burkholderiaceae bacterium]